MTVPKCIYGNNKTMLNKNSLRTIEAQIVQKLKNNTPRPKFIGSYKKKKRAVLYILFALLLPMAIFSQMQRVIFKDVLS